MFAYIYMYIFILYILYTYYIICICIYIIYIYILKDDVYIYSSFLNLRWDVWTWRGPGQEFCPYANHGAGIWIPTFARTKSPSFVGKYTSTMVRIWVSYFNLFSVPIWNMGFFQYLATKRLLEAIARLWALLKRQNIKWKHTIAYMPLDFERTSFGNVQRVYASQPIY